MKISGSIEHLILNQTECSLGLTKDFFLALGENKTIQSLHLNSLQGSSSKFSSNLGIAVAINVMKKGSLNTLSCLRGFSGSTLDIFINHLCISEQDHELWYGDKNTAKKMSGSDVEKELH